MQSNLGLHKQDRFMPIDADSVYITAKIHDYAKRDKITRDTKNPSDNQNENPTPSTQNHLIPNHIGNPIGHNEHP